MDDRYLHVGHMLAQQLIRMHLKSVSFAIAIPLLSAIIASFCPMTAAETLKPIQPQRPNAVTQAEFITTLFDLSGKPLLQVKGGIWGFSPTGQLVIQNDVAAGMYSLFDRSGRQLLQFQALLSIQFSPNGQYLLVDRSSVASADYQLYDVQGKKIVKLPGADPFLPVFSQNSQQILAASESGTDIFSTSGKQIAHLENLFFKNSSFLADGQRLILFSNGRNLTLEPTNQKLEATCTLLDKAGKTIDRVSGSCLGVGPRGKTFVTYCENNQVPTLSLYDFSGQKITQLSGNIATFSSDEKYILTMDGMNSSHSDLYTVQGRKVGRLKGRYISFNSTSQRIITILNNTVYLYDVSGKEMAQVPGKRGVFLPNSNYFLTSLLEDDQYSLQNLRISAAPTSRLFDGTGREVTLLQGELDKIEYPRESLSPVSLPLGWEETLDTLEVLQPFFVSPDGQRFVTRDFKSPGSSYLYSTSGQLIAQLPGRFLWFDATGKYGLAKTGDEVYVFDRSGRQMMKAKGEFGVFSPDGRSVAISAKR